MDGTKTHGCIQPTQVEDFPPVPVLHQHFSLQVLLTGAHETLLSFFFLTIVGVVGGGGKEDFQEINESLSQASFARTHYFFLPQNCSLSLEQSGLDCFLLHCFPSGLPVWLIRPSDY